MPPDGFVFSKKSRPIVRRRYTERRRVCWDAATGGGTYYDRVITYIYTLRFVRVVDPSTLFIALLLLLLSLLFIVVFENSKIV